jgi:hypothetical protein
MIGIGRYIGILAMSADAMSQSAPDVVPAALIEVKPCLPE